jgi:hypothetical protein
MRLKKRDAACGLAMFSPSRKRHLFSEKEQEAYPVES